MLKRTLFLITAGWAFASLQRQVSPNLARFVGTIVYAGRKRCSGALYNGNILITTAGCASGVLESYRVMTDTNTTSVLSVTRHPKHNINGDTKYNIALMKLNLAHKDTGLLLQFGFESTSYHLVGVSELSSMTDTAVNVVPQRDCKDAHRGYFYPPIHFCAAASSSSIPQHLVQGAPLLQDQGGWVYLGGIYLSNQGTSLSLVNRVRALRFWISTEARKLL